MFVCMYESVYVITSEHACLIELQLVLMICKV